MIDSHLGPATDYGPRRWPSDRRALHDFVARCVGVLVGRFSGLPIRRAGGESLRTDSLRWPSFGLLELRLRGKMRGSIRAFASIGDESGERAGVPSWLD